MPRLNDRQIRAFRATVASGSVTAAAMALSVSQPAVSRILRTLEEEVGFAVLERSGRGVRPTRQGQLLFDEAERLYAGLGDLEHSAGLIRQGRIGHLRIAAVPAFVDTLVAPCIGSFLKQRPQVAVDLEVLKTNSILEGIRGQHFDLGIAFPTHSDPQVDREILSATPTVCIMGPGHPLARHARISAATLSGHDMIALPIDSPQRLTLDAAMARRGFAPQIAGTARTQSAICEIISAGAPAVAVVEATLARRHAATLVIRPLSFTVHSIAAAFSPGSGMSELAAAFMDVLRDRAP